MFRVFVRSWWRPNSAWPGGREPHAGRKTTLALVATEAMARRYCQSYNDTHNPGKWSRKAEYERVSD